MSKDEMKTQQSKVNHLVVEGNALITGEAELRGGINLGDSGLIHKVDMYQMGGDHDALPSSLAVSEHVNGEVNELRTLTYTEINRLREESRSFTQNEVSQIRSEMNYKIQSLEARVHNLENA